MSDAHGGFWGDPSEPHDDGSADAADAPVSGGPIAKGQIAAFFVADTDDSPQDDAGTTASGPFVRLPEKR
jgi:hypothetical protein